MIANIIIQYECPFSRYDNKDEAAYAIQSLDGTMLPNALQPLSVKIAEEHGKMKASYFAGMQAGKTMAMGHEYGGYGGYATGGNMLRYIN